MGPRDPPEGLSMSCLGPDYAIEITVAMPNGNFFYWAQSTLNCKHEENDFAVKLNTTKTRTFLTNPGQSGGKEVAVLACCW